MLDFGVVLLSLFFGLKGLITGFIAELLNFLGILGGVFIASRAAKPISTSLKGFFTTTNSALIEAVIFFIILGVAIFATKMVAKLIKEPKNNLLNRFGGYIVAVIKYFIIFSVIITILANNPTLKRKIDSISIGSRLYSYMIDTGKFFLNRE